MGEPSTMSDEEMIGEPSKLTSHEFDNVMLTGINPKQYPEELPDLIHQFSFEPLYTNSH